MEENPRCWSIKQTSDFIGISVRTLYEWQALGIGPPRFKIGTMVRYRSDLVMEWLDRYRQLTKNVEGDLIEQLKRKLTESPELERLKRLKDEMQAIDNADPAAELKAEMAKLDARAKRHG